MGIGECEVGKGLTDFGTRGVIFRESRTSGVPQWGWSIEAVLVAFHRHTFSLLWRILYIDMLRVNSIYRGLTL